jgi:hypothetical protein
MSSDGASRQSDGLTSPGKSTVHPVPGQSPHPDPIPGSDPLSPADGGEGTASAGLVRSGELTGDLEDSAQAQRGVVEDVTVEHPHPWAIVVANREATGR